MPRLQLLLWTLLALVNLASAFTVWRTTDFVTMYDWTSEWLWRGTDLFGAGPWATDYPPTAVVVLAPIALVNVHVSAWAWGLLNVALVMMSGVLCVWTMKSGRRPLSTTWLLVSTLICWSASRTLLQFTLFSLACGLASVWIAPTRPKTSGVLLGLALIKPQVALPYVVALAATRRWRPLVAATSTSAALWTIYCVRARAWPLETASHFARRLVAMYSGPHAQVGVSELARLAPSGREDLVAMITALTLSLAVAVVAARAWQRADAVEPGIGLLLAGATAASMLVACRHLSYAFVTLAPAATWLLLADAQSAGHRRLFWMLQAGMIVDIPTLHRAMATFGWSTASSDLLLPHADRVLLLAWTMVLLRLTWVATAAKPQSHVERTPMHASALADEGPGWLGAAA